jgi:hypothetical protein
MNYFRIKIKQVFIILGHFIIINCNAQTNYHWHHLNQGISLGNPVTGFINGMLPDSSSGKLIVFGTFSNNTSINNMAIWDGNQQWLQYGDYNQFDALSTEIRTAIYFHDTLFFSELYGSASCPSNKSNPGLMYYSGTQICHFNGGFCNTIQGPTWIFSFTSYKDTLYATGNFRNANCGTINQDSTFFIAKLSGGNFTSVGNGNTLGIFGTHGATSGFKLYSNPTDLFVTGFFTQVNGLSQNNIARTDGINWLLVPEANAPVYDIISWNNDLYILSDALYKLAGNAWVQIAQFANGANPGFATCLEVFNGELVVGGGFTTVNGFPANCIAKFNGTTWDNMDGGTTSFTPEVRDLLSWNGSLYACGRFDQMGTVQANKIARWGLTSSLVDMESKIDLKILTNPCHEQLQISMGFSSTPLPFELLDARGRLTLNGNLNAGANEININGVSPGVYIIHQQQNKFKPMRVLVY